MTDLVASVFGEVNGPEIVLLAEAKDGTYARLVFEAGVALELADMLHRAAEPLHARKVAA